MKASRMVARAGIEPATP